MRGIEDMAYEHKESIKDAVNEVYSASFADELNRKNELDEVYRKSQAFDTLLHTYERYRHSHAHDLKLLLGMKAIELLEADE